MGRFLLKWWRVILILAVLCWSWVTSFDRWDPREPKVTLGLDLRGGSYLVLRVKAEDMVAGEANRAAEDLRARLAEKGIAFQELVAEGGMIRLGGYDPAKKVELETLLRENFSAAWDLDLALGDPVATLSISDRYAQEIKEGAVKKALEIIDKRINEFGVAEPLVNRQGGAQNDRIVLQLPGVSENEARRLKDIIRTTSFLEWRALAAPEGQSDSFIPGNGFATQEEALAAFGGSLPPDAELLPYRERRPDATVTRWFPVKKAAVVTGNQLQTARTQPDQFGQPSVGFQLDADGGKRFGEFSAGHIGQRAAIILDGAVVTAPVIQSAIYGPGQITGQFTLEEAEDLSLTLRAGALPAGIEILEERTVGPSLGNDSIRQGIRASAWGLVVLFLAALLYYGGAGVNAVLALCLNGVLVLALMTSIGATMTLPGIAGLILSIGMAVDANVLVFERIKEELRLGRSVGPSIANGFSKALGTIIDSNLTTVIACLFLFQFGTGPVRGFAVSLMIGLVASMFTAVFVSRVIFDLVYGGRQVRGISILPLFRVLRPAEAA